jgi:integrase
MLHSITRDIIDDLVVLRKQEGVSNATVNRMLAVLRAILRRAALDWEWLDKVPRFKLLPEPKRRVRWLTREAAGRLISELPEHLAEMVRFTLATGLRQANVTQLEWSQVDLKIGVAWIHADQAKARKPISVPLSEYVMLVLKRQQGRHTTRVFTYEGKPVRQVNTKAWRNALKRAGITDFRWHDLRHTWASWHVQKGTPLNALQELGAWESADMVRRYAHLGQNHLAHYAENLCQPD